jgi:CRP/FNR family transcriptional regulator, cyclic AMP receptor protein
MNSAVDLTDALPTLLRDLARRSEPRRYRKNTVLIHEGDRGDTLFIVLQGRVKAFSTDERGREIVYGAYGPGEFLGEMSLDGGPRSASVVTLETVVCSVIARQTLLTHISEHPEFAFELIARVIHRARMATQSARGMALLDVYGRLVRQLDELGVEQEDGSRLIREKLTQHELAARVGCSREMISHLMRDLKLGEYLRLEGSAIRLLRPLPQQW